MGQTVTISGNLGADPERKTTASAKPMVTFSIGRTERRQNPEGGWSDGATSWFKVLAFDRLAENAARSLHRGEPVIVVGDLTINDWSGKDGQVRREVQVKATSIGHDLTRGTAHFEKVLREQSSASSAQPLPEDAPAVPPTAVEGAQTDLSGRWGVPPGSQQEAPRPPAPAGPLLADDDEDDVPF